MLTTPQRPHQPDSNSICTATSTGGMQSAGNPGTAVRRALWLSVTTAVLFCCSVQIASAQQKKEWFENLSWGYQSGRYYGFKPRGDTQFYPPRMQGYHQPQRVTIPQPINQAQPQAVASPQLVPTPHFAQGTTQLNTCCCPQPRCATSGGNSPCPCAVR